MCRSQLLLFQCPVFLITYAFNKHLEEKNEKLQQDLFKIKISLVIQIENNKSVLCFV